MSLPVFCKTCAHVIVAVLLLSLLFLLTKMTGRLCGRIVKYFGRVSGFTQLHDLDTGKGHDISPFFAITGSISLLKARPVL